MRAAFAFASLGFVVGFVGACSFFVDTGGLDTQTGAPDATNDTTADVIGDVFVADAGGDAKPDVSLDATPDSCPSGGGPTMVALPGLCIDSTEVTVGQYKQFVTAVSQGYNPVVAQRCEWNLLWNIGAGGPECSVPDDNPVSCVNWCQAYAFCAWSGKHLCGGRTGGSVPYGSFSDPNQSAWASACTSNSTNQYAFGNAYAPVCNMPDPNDQDGGAGTVAVASLTQCQGPTGVFDLMGNASEWIDSCEEDDAGVGDSDYCHHVGGAFAQYEDCFGDDNDPRDFDYYAGYAIGFRCCSP